METGIIFGERLRALRGKIGVSQRGVASELGISQQNYQCYEKGVKMPTAGKLPTLADFFNVSVDYLLGRTDEPQLPDKETLALARQLQAYRQNEQPAQN